MQERSGLRNILTLLIVFREFMRKWMKEHPKSNGENYNIYRDGLKIYVTLDSRLQENAEEAMTEHLTNLQRIFFLFFISRSWAILVAQFVPKKGICNTQKKIMKATDQMPFFAM